MIRELISMLKTPEMFFESIREEGCLRPFSFLLRVSIVIAVFSPIVNYLGWPSTDRTSTYQAQIIAWRITSTHLLPRLGIWAYVVESLLILVLALVIALLLTVVTHFIFRALGGQGSILNAWKSICYGTGPCAFFGWVPYWSLFVGSLSLVFQLYYGPKALYRVKEGRALLILAFFVGTALLEFATKGTTVGIGW